MTFQSLKALSLLQAYKGVAFLRRTSWRSLQQDNSPHHTTFHTNSCSKSLFVSICQKKSSTQSSKEQEPANSARRYLGEGPPGTVSCQPASCGSLPAMFILHVFSSANKRAAKETMPQERRAKQQCLGHCRNQSLLPSIPKHTTNQFHYLNTFGTPRTTVPGPKF